MRPGKLWALRISADQVARDVVAFGETVECLAGNEVLGDLSFELDAMGAVPGHGFHPLKARQYRSIPNLQTVHRQGRSGQSCRRSWQRRLALREPAATDHILFIQLYFSRFCLKVRHGAE